MWVCRCGHISKNFATHRRAHCVDVPVQQSPALVSRSQVYLAPVLRLERRGPHCEGRLRLNRDHLGTPALLCFQVQHLSRVVHAEVSSYSEVAAAFGRVCPPKSVGPECHYEKLKI